MQLNPGARGLADVFPQLELIIHGGIPFTPYRDRFRRVLEGTNAETRESYLASESSIAIADRADGEGLRLIFDNGTFFEFVPVTKLTHAEPTRHWLANFETGVEYAVIISTCAGAGAYILGDTVRFIERDPPRLMVTGRTSYLLSMFGEHVIAEQIEQALYSAATAAGAAVVDYSVGVLFSEADKVGRHCYFVEFADRTPDVRGMNHIHQCIGSGPCGFKRRFSRAPSR